MAGSDEEFSTTVVYERYNREIDVVAQSTLAVISAMQQMGGLSLICRMTSKDIKTQESTNGEREKIARDNTF